MAVSPGELQLLRMTTDLRTQLMASLVDADLGFAMPGNPPLGDLCRAIGDTERAYIDSFRTGRMSWAVRNDEPGLSGSVELLVSWYAALDAELETVLGDIPEEQFRDGHVQRDDGFEMPTGAQFHAWREAILIFCAKADVYRRAMGKPRSEHWEHWIG